MFFMTFILCIVYNYGIDAKTKPCHIRVDAFNKPYKGKCSWFKINKKAAINPKAKNYVAMRWDYKALAQQWGIKQNEVKLILKDSWVLLINPENGKRSWGQCADWGPAKWTGRCMDLDPAIMKILECKTDDVLIAIPCKQKTILISLLSLSFDSTLSSKEITQHLMEI